LNNKGLAYSLFVIIGLLFLFGICALVGLTGWFLVNDTVQNMDNETVRPDVKVKINEYTDVMLWSDKIFIMFFVALIIGFMVTSFTISTDNTIYIILYFIFLVFISLFSMVISNGWHYLINNPNFIDAAAELSFTNYVFKYMPIIVFMMGLIGGVLFYARKKKSDSSYNVDYPSNEGGEF